jgi:hypothetical protein
MRYHGRRRTLGTRFPHGSRHRQYDELNAPRPPPAPWVPFRWGPATNSPDVTDDPPVTAATQHRPDSTWPVGQFLIQLVFPDGEQANQTLLVSGLLLVLALERQLGKLVGCKEAAIYVNPIGNDYTASGTSPIVFCPTPLFLALPSHT